MKNNRVLFATLVVLLWIVNALDLQPYEFELRSTVAISKHRVPLLRSLANNSMTTVNIGGQAVGMRLVSCEAFESDKVTSLGSNAFSNDNHLQTVKVRVRYQRFADIEAIERWLESETRPTDLSERCRTLKGQIRSAKWRLDSLEHTQRVLFEDQRRRAEQVALQDHVKQATIKLVGFQRSSQRRTSEQEVIDKLAFQIQDERNTITQLSKEWDREIAVSNGFLQFSGAPKWFPVAESVGWRRGLAFIVLSVAIWAVCRFTIQGAGYWIQAGSQLPMKIFHARRTTLRIPHLGHVELVTGHRKHSLQLDDKVESRGLAYPDSFRDAKATASTRGRSVPLSNGEKWVRGIVGSAFVMWAAVVAARLVFDPAWRSLFISAPLAALSNLISGVGL